MRRIIQYFLDLRICFSNQENFSQYVMRLLQWQRGFFLDLLRKSLQIAHHSHIYLSTYQGFISMLEITWNSCSKSRFFSDKPILSKRDDNVTFFPNKVDLSERNQHYQMGKPVVRSPGPIKWLFCDEPP